MLSTFASHFICIKYAKLTILSTGLISSPCALHRKLTDAEKKVVDKIDEALNTTVTRTAQFVGLLDGTAGTMDLVGDVLGMTW